MNTIRYISMMIIAGFLITACDSHCFRTVVGTGDVVSMEIQVPAFTGVSVTGTCNVDIETGEPQEVELSAQQEVLDVMTYEVKGGILHIGFDPDYSVNTNKEISADIVIPAVSSIAVTGVGDFDLSGSKQASLDINITGTGNVDAFDMEVDDCTIRISGTGNCEVRVNNSLDIIVSGVGNVFYKGNPEITSSISGVGNVTDVNN